MSKLKEHLLTESSLLGRRNSSVPKSEIADAIADAMEDIRWNLEVVKKTGNINMNYVKELSKIITDLRKLGDKIVADVKGQEK